MRALLKNLAVFSLVLSLVACSSYNSDNNNSYSTSNSSNQELLSQQENRVYADSYNDWKGTPYQYGGNNKYGIDCSAFVQAIILQAHGYNMPRTTHEQSRHGNQIAFTEAKSGDLLFFKTSKKNRHVGIYLGDNKFMHASTSKGVIISRLNNPYWASTFWQVRRII